jgi:DNA-binding response OmpR family regulator
MARILVVDDEEMDRMLVRAILEAAGHELFYAGEGDSALQLLRDNPVDLVLTDLAMPDFNGLRFIKELREEGFRVPVIAVSGRAVDQLDLAESYGADLTMIKPIDEKHLLLAVNKMLEVSRPRDQDDPWGRGW